jgi:hypothetical protein
LLLVPVADRDDGHLCDIRDFALGQFLITALGCQVDRRGRTARRGFAGVKSALDGHVDDLFRRLAHLLVDVELRAEPRQVLLGIDRFHDEIQLLGDVPVRPPDFLALDP